MNSKLNIFYYKSSMALPIFMPAKSSTESIQSFIYSLKLGNLMLNENMELKIGDFGLAAKL